jgi:hypothetical protein
MGLLVEALVAENGFEFWEDKLRKSLSLHAVHTHAGIRKKGGDARIRKHDKRMVLHIWSCAHLY